MQEPDRIRLQHMFDAARDAMQFARRRTRDDLESDRQFVMALVKCVEIVGEAAAQVAHETRAELPDIPWRDMIDMRHRLVHAYYDINHTILWRTIQEDLPPLVKMLRGVLRTRK